MRVSRRDRTQNFTHPNKHPSIPNRQRNNHQQKGLFLMMIRRGEDGLNHKKKEERNV